MPTIKFDSPSGNADNKGSCGKIVSYLEKEDKLKEENKEFFFNHRNDMIPSFEVQRALDSNQQGLGKNDAKWYSGSISFSKDELQHVNNNPEDLKRYAIEFFKVLAENYNRGVTIDDLNYFIKMETSRTFKGNSPEVKAGLEKQGDPKPGLQTHFHFIIGRKSMDGTKKLSPKTNHQHTAKGPITASFDRDALIEKAERRFDLMFNYNRPINQTYKNYKIMKNGEQNERLESIENTVDLEFKLKLFLASPTERKDELIEQKIEQINAKLREKDLLNKKQINRYGYSSLNGRTYSQLLNLEQLIDKKGIENINPIGFICQGIENLQKPLKEQSPKNLAFTMEAFVQLINQELPSTFAIDPRDILPNPEQIDLKWLGHLVNGAYEDNQPLLASLVGVNYRGGDLPFYTNLGEEGSLTHEINKAGARRGIFPQQPLTQDFVRSLSDKYSENQIKSAMLSVKELIIHSPENDKISNLNLFLASTLIHSQKNYSEMPKSLRQEAIRKYANFINAQLKNHGIRLIDVREVLQVEDRNDYSGRVFGYLNAINSKIKKQDYPGAESIINQHPQQFINANFNPTYSHGDQLGIPFSSQMEGSQSNPGPDSDFMNWVPESNFLLPPIAIQPKSGNDEEEEWERRKRKKKERRDRDQGMSM